MARRMVKQTRIWIALENGNERVASVITTNRGKATNALKGTRFTKGYIKITYPLGKDFINDADFCDLERGLRFLQIFTDADLVRYCS